MPPARTPGRPAPRLAVERLEDRAVPAASPLYISEVHFDPLFGNNDVDEYFEIRGAAGATIPAGTYFVVVDGDNGPNSEMGKINSIFDLGGLTLGSDGYLVVTEQGSNYAIVPTATILKGTTTGFGGLPNNRFTDNSSLSDRFEFIFGANTFMLIQTGSKPAPDEDVDANDDGKLDGAGAGWNVLDAVGVLGTFTGGDATQQSYGKITFAVGGLGKAPAGTPIITSTDFGYVGRVGESTGYGPFDWVAGQTVEAPPSGSFNFRFESSIFGHPTIGYLAGRSLDNLGTANFISSVGGTKFVDANGNGVFDPGEQVQAGSSMFLDRNGDGIRDSYTTTVEPDNFPDKTELTNAIHGVTLTEADSNNVQVGRGVAASLDTGNASTGVMTIGKGGINWWDNSSRLRMDFYKPVQSVSIDFISPTLLANYGRLTVFAADGTQLQTFLSPAVANGQVTTLRIDRPTADIAYAVAYTDPSGFDFGRLDHLVFSQPEDLAQSGNDGSYKIDGLQDGTYTVREARRPGFSTSFPLNGSYTVTIANLVPARGLNFGNSPGGLTVGQLLAVGGDAGDVTVFTPNGGGAYDPSAPTTVGLVPFPTFTGDVRTATADVNGDGVEDVVVVTGPGVPIQFAVISGTDFSTYLISPMSPFRGSEDFTGGGYVAAGDLDGDLKAEVVVTADQGGGPRVTIFSLLAGKPTVRADFLGIDDPNFRGGARPAVGDVNGDKVQDLVVAAGFLGGPRVAVYDGRTLFSGRSKLTGDFFAFEQNLRNGAFPAVGDVDGDGYGDLIFGAGPGGASRVVVYSGRTLSLAGAAAIVGQPIASFYTTLRDDGSRGGVRVTAKDVDGDKLADIVTGSGEGQPAQVKVYLGKTVLSSRRPPSIDLDMFNGVSLTDGVFVG